MHRAEAAHAALRHDRERKHWEAVLRARPTHQRALRRAAELASLLGDSDRAEAIWKRALELPALEPRAHGELARLAFDRRELREARSHADSYLSTTEPQQRGLGLRHQIESLRAHLDAPPSPSGIRHICVTGVAFCGSTLLGHLLGGLPGVANIGESQGLVQQLVDFVNQDIDFDAGPNEITPRCNGCGLDCPVWTWETRRALSQDRRDWYLKIADHLDTRILVSTDKNHRKQLLFDPWLRFDAVVLFRHPRHAWKSASKPGRKPRSVEAYLERWDEQYRKLAFDLPNQGKKLFLHLDAFKADPHRHLLRLAELLDLPRPGDGVGSDPSHSIGGNARVNSAFREQTHVEIVPDQRDEIPADEARRVVAYTRHSDIFAYMRARHRALFPASGEPLRS